MTGHCGGRRFFAKVRSQPERLAVLWQDKTTAIRQQSPHEFWLIRMAWNDDFRFHSVEQFLQVARVHMTAWIQVRIEFQFALRTERNALGLHPIKLDPFALDSHPISG